MEYVVSGLAGISTTAHMHRMPKGQAASSTDDCKAEGTDLADSQRVDDAIQ